MMLKAGDTIERYRIEEAIGEGGMGRVFRAHDERLDRKVAIKIVNDDERQGSDSRARLVREARAVAKLDHPNIVAVYDVGDHTVGPYIVMELVEGRSLRSLIDDVLVTPLDRVRILAEVARALAVAHDAGIVHRDVKPENVLVRKDGRVKVVDFGIARRTKSATLDGSSPTTDSSLATLTSDGVKVGTPKYMAPEQIRGGEVDGRADQFAWAVTAYELFVGKPPWGGDSMALIAAILTEDPAPPPPHAQMPRAFSGVVRKALNKKPEERFSSMHSLIRALDAAGMPSLMGAIPAPVGPSGGRPGPLPGGGGFGGPGVPHGAVPPRGLGGSPVPLGAPRLAPQPFVPQMAPKLPARPHFGGPGGAPQLFMTRRYGLRDLADIFDRALANQNRQCTYDELAQTAAEFGLDGASINRMLTELSRRGALAPSDQQRNADRMRVKKLLGIWGVLSAFFLLLNLFSLRSLWFQYPVVVMGVPFGLMIVSTLFRTPSRAPNVHTGDAGLEHDVARITQSLGQRASGSAQNAAANAANVRIANPDVPASPHGNETMRQAEAELEAFLSASPKDPDAMRRRDN